MASLGGGHVAGVSDEFVLDLVQSPSISFIARSQLPILVPEIGLQELGRSQEPENIYVPWVIPGPGLVAIKDCPDATPAKPRPAPATAAPRKNERRDVGRSLDGSSLVFSVFICNLPLV